MGVLLIIYTISFILCVLYTCYLIYTTYDEEALQFYKSKNISIDKLNTGIKILSVGSVIPVVNTLYVVYAIIIITREFFFY